MINVDSFVEFKDIGQEDYIIDLGRKLLCNKMPLNRYTADDITGSVINLDTPIYEKEFKNIISNFSDSGYGDEIPVEKTTPHKNTNKVQKIVEEKINNVTENLSNEIHNEFNSAIQEQNINIESLIVNKMEESNSYTDQTIMELEQHLNHFNQNNFITRNEMRQLETKIVNNNEVHYKDLKEEIKEHKNFFEKFINS